MGVCCGLYHIWEFNGVLMQCIKLTKESKGKYTAQWENGHPVGDILMDVDGYWKWWPNFGESTGCLDELFLYSMGSTLKDLNKEWDAQINEYFSNRHREYNLQ